MKLRTVFWQLALALPLVLLAAGVGLYFGLRAALAPLPGEWTVPLRFGPLRITAGVPSLIRLATSPWGGPLLHGRVLRTRAGPVQLSWQAEARTLGLRCAPCTLQLPGLGQQPVQLADLRLTVRRRFEWLSGEVAAGAVRGSWQGAIERERLRLHWSVPATPLGDGYALFAGAIPELAQARIGGNFALDGRLELPARKLQVTPRIEGFEVAGLNTEALLGARSGCGRASSRLGPESWLARAVVAAEDQRFFEHPGYDLTELGAALARNQEHDRVERGASTLSQQLAKLLVTGDAQSPVRKLRELLVAVEMERTLGKPRILRLYLDNAPWGPGLCGAEAAARFYFDRRAHELGPAQAAWLAAMLHNPGLEARRWAEQGQIDQARAKWVVHGMRGLGRERKQALIEDLPLLDWAPAWAPPAAAAAAAKHPAAE